MVVVVVEGGVRHDEPTWTISRTLSLDQLVHFSSM